MELLTELAGTEWLGNPVLRWLKAGGLAFVAAGILYVLRGFALRYLNRLAKRTVNRIDDIIAGTLSKTSLIAIVAVSCYVAGHYLMFGKRVDRVLNIGLAVAFSIQFAIWLQTFIALSLDEWRVRHNDKRNHASMAATIRFVSRLIIWTLVSLFIASNLGLRLDAVITGLGIGGVAAALAVQSVLGDLFASLSIYFDRPFEIGDFVIVDEYLGVVEQVGLRSTRVRALSGEQVVFPNADLSRSRIRNYGRMFERRIVFKLGVTYQTHPSKLEAIPGIVRTAVEAQKNARFDRCHFFQYGDFSLNYEIVYFVLSPDYNTYMDIQQAVNLQIFRDFAAQNIDFAYPTQTLYHQRLASPEDAVPVPDAK